MTLYFKATHPETGNVAYRSSTGRRYTHAVVYPTGRDINASTSLRGAQNIAAQPYCRTGTVVELTEVTSKEYREGKAATRI